MLNRDFFRETIRFDANGAGGANGTGTQGNHASQSSQIDYDRIQQMLDGTLRAKEENDLKAYFS